MAYSNIQPVVGENAAKYKYYTVDIVSNTIIGEIPFEDVNYSRSLKSAGSFNGKITTSQETENLDLYNSTMPGKTALYVVRNDECVWGGIIWGRTYDMLGRSLSVSASEFTSYLSRRLIWKTNTRSFSANLSTTPNAPDGVFKVSLTSGSLRQPLDIFDGAGVRNTVYVTMPDAAMYQYNGYYGVLGTGTQGVPENPSTSSFYVSIPTMPQATNTNKTYYEVSITTKADTYEYIRSLITEAFSDFSEIDFANEIIEPGVKIPIKIETKKLVTTDSTHGVATFTTEANHELIVGEEVLITNVDTLLDGEHVVSEVPSKKSFKVTLDNPVSSYDKKTKITLDDIPTTDVTSAKTLIQRREKIFNMTRSIKKITRTLGVVTLFLDAPHTYVKTQKVIVTIPKKAPWKKTIDGKETDLFNYGAETGFTITSVDMTNNSLTFNELETKYNDSKYNITSNVPIEDKKITNVKMATPETRLRLTPLNDLGFSRGDYIKVSGVDDLDWRQPLYNGYVSVDESNYGSPNPILKYALSNSLDEEFGLLTLYFSNLPDTDDDPGISTIEPLADVLISDLDPRFDNQVWQTTGGANSGQPFAPWKVEFIVPYLSTNSTPVNASANAAVRVNGTKWFQYRAAYSSATSVSPEPYAVNGIQAVKYIKPSKADKYGKLTIWTVDTHRYNIGDGIGISFSDDAARAAFDGTRTVIAVGADGDGNNNSVSFNIPAGNASSAIARTTKSGTLTRKSALLTPPKIESIGIKDIQTKAGNLLEVVTDLAHPFVEGDYIVISAPNAANNSLINNGEPVQIVSVVDDYTFQYISLGKVSPLKVGNVRSISTSEDGSQMTITTGGVANVSISPRTLNITNVVNSLGTLDLALITVNASHGTEFGENVTISSLPTATFGSPATIAANNRSITSIQQGSAGGVDTLTFSLSASHGLNAADIDKYWNNLITVSGLSTSSNFTYEDQKVYPAVLRRSLFSTIIQQAVVKGSVSANVVTVYTDVVHGFAAGDVVFVDGVYPFHGTYTITSIPTTTSFRYARTAPNRALANTFAYATVTRLKTQKMNLSIYNRSYRIIDIPSNTSLTVQAGNGSSIPDWYVAVGDVASGSISIPAMTGIAPQLTPNYSLLNGTHTVFDTLDPSFPSKFYVRASALNTAKEQLSGAPGAGTVTFSGKVKSIANSTPHGLVAGDSVSISGLGGYYDTSYGSYIPLNMVNSTHRVLSVTSTTFTISNPLAKAATGYGTYFVNKQLSVDELSSAVVNRFVDVTGMLAYKDYRRLSPANIKRITSISRRSDGSGASVTAPGHGLENNDIVYINAYGGTSSVFNQGNKPVVILDATADTFTYDFYPVTDIDRVSVTMNKAVLYTAYGQPHRFAAGDTIALSAFPTGVYANAFNGNSFLVLSASADKIVIETVGLTDRRTPLTLAQYGSVEFAVGGKSTVSATGGTVTVAPTASKQAIAFRKSYGGFPRNADMGGMEFSTDNYSTYKQASQVIRGSQLVNLGGLLEQYSSSINGFDYRIDCRLEEDSTTNTYRFKRVFTLVPILPATFTEYLENLNYSRQDPLTLEVGLGLAPGQVADPVAFGADKIVFEYPGNISNVSVAENSESSATRVFITGSSNGDAGEGNVRYSAASATDLLAVGWPILDRAENQSWPLLTKEGAVNVDNWGNYDIEIDLYKTAKRFLYESKPPIGDFTISVNGSMNPTVGTFNPGDWCSLNINDAFVKSRLASALELRKNVIVRKIDTISVSVPNNPAFPEQVDLTLVTDWQVDKVGE